MADHPTTDGQTEQVNQEVEQFLRPFVNQHQDNWYEWLSIAKFAYNNQACLNMLIPIHAQHQTEPLARHGTA